MPRDTLGDRLSATSPFVAGTAAPLPTMR